MTTTLRKTVDINYVMRKLQRVHIAACCGGQHQTRDNVILREMRLPTRQFNVDKLKRSSERLDKLATSPA
jgi:outer membrane protein assembly factor BamA